MSMEWQINSGVAGQTNGDNPYNITVYRQEPGPVAVSMIFLYYLQIVHDHVI